MNRDKRGMMTRRKGTKDCQISHLLHISVRQVKLNDFKKQKNDQILGFTHLGFLGLCLSLSFSVYSTLILCSYYFLVFKGTKPVSDGNNVRK